MSVSGNRRLTFRFERADEGDVLESISRIITEANTNDGEQ
jgi:hypothetical protein